MSSNFFAIMSRMKYIERWALMRSSRAENLSEHSLETAMIAHMLCIIGNIRYGKNLDAEKAALIGMYHDASEVITGDMPTPVKYYSSDIQKAYKEIEKAAGKKLLSSLPEDIKSFYENIYSRTVLKAKMTVGLPLNVDKSKNTCHFISQTDGREYLTSLEQCTCPAFCNRPDEPCKHMVALAAYLGYYQYKD